MNRRSILIFALVASVAPSTRADDPGDGRLGLADVAAERDALRPIRPEDPPPASATFRDLWDRPASFRGRRVEVVGKVARVFHQGAVGSFPALAEAWLATPTGDPICVVFPEQSGTAAPPIGRSVRFVGTMLKRVRYRGADADRLAPLVVGPDVPRIDEGPIAPEPTGVEPAVESALSGRGGLALAVVAGLVTAGAIARIHLRKPGPTLRRRSAADFDDGLAPSFLDAPTESPRG